MEQEVHSAGVCGRGPVAEWLGATGAGWMRWVAEVAGHTVLENSAVRLPRRPLPLVGQHVAHCGGLGDLGLGSASHRW